MQQKQCRGKEGDKRSNNNKEVWKPQRPTVLGLDRGGRGVPPPCSPGSRFKPEVTRSFAPPGEGSSHGFSGGRGPVAPAEGAREGPALVPPVSSTRFALLAARGSGGTLRVWPSCSASPRSKRRGSAAEEDAVEASEPRRERGGSGAWFAVGLAGAAAEATVGLVGSSASARAMPCDSAATLMLLVATGAGAATAGAAEDEKKESSVSQAAPREALRDAAAGAGAGAGAIQLLKLLLALVLLLVLSTNETRRGGGSGRVTGATAARLNGGGEGTASREPSAARTSSRTRCRVVSAASTAGASSGRG